MKILKNRKMTASDSDKYAIRLLRQEYWCNEQQHTLGMIDDDEYDRTLTAISDKLTVLECKYGMGQN